MKVRLLAMCALPLAAGCAEFFTPASCRPGSGADCQCDVQGRTVGNGTIVPVTLANGDAGFNSCFQGYWGTTDCGTQPYAQCKDAYWQKAMGILALEAQAAPPSRPPPVYTNCTSIGASTNCTTTQC